MSTQRCRFRRSLYLRSRLRKTGLAPQPVQASPAHLCHADVRGPVLQTNRMFPGRSAQPGIADIQVGNVIIRLVSFRSRRGRYLAASAYACPGVKADALRRICFQKLPNATAQDSANQDIGIKNNHPRVGAFPRRSFLNSATSFLVHIRKSFASRSAAARSSARSADLARLRGVGT